MLKMMMRCFNGGRYIGRVKEGRSGISPDIYLNQGTFRKIEQDNCFIIQQIDNKAKFYCSKAGDHLYFAIFLSETRSYVYRRISVDYGRRAVLGSVAAC